MNITIKEFINTEQELLKSFRQCLDDNCRYIQALNENNFAFTYNWYYADMEKVPRG